MKKKKFFSVWSPEPLYDARRPLWGRFLAWGLVFTLLWGSFVSGGFTGLSRAFANGGGVVAGEAGSIATSSVPAGVGAWHIHNPIFRVGIQRNDNYLFRTEAEKTKLSDKFKDHIPVNRNTGLYFVDYEASKDYTNPNDPVKLTLGYWVDSTKAVEPKIGKTSEPGFLKRIFFAKEAAFNPFYDYKNKVALTDRSWGYRGVLLANYTLNSSNEPKKTPVRMLANKKPGTDMYEWEFFTDKGRLKGTPIGLKNPVGAQNTNREQERLWHWILAGVPRTNSNGEVESYDYEIDKRINRFISNKYLYTDGTLNLDKLKTNPKASEEVYFGYLDLLMITYSSMPENIQPSIKNAWREAITDYIKTPNLTKKPVTLVIDTVMAVETSHRNVSFVPTYEVLPLVTAIPSSLHPGSTTGIVDKRLDTSSKNSDQIILNALQAGLNYFPIAAHLRKTNALYIQDPFTMVATLMNKPGLALWSEEYSKTAMYTPEIDLNGNPASVMASYLETLNFDKATGLNGFLLVQFSNLNLPQETTLGMLAYPKNQQSPFAKQLMAGKPVRIEFDLSNSGENDFLKSLIDNNKSKLNSIKSIKLIASTDSTRTVESNNADVLETFKKENLSEIKKSDIYIKETNEKLLGEDNGSDFKNHLKINQQKIILNFTDKKINELLMGDTEKAKKAAKDLKDHEKGKITLSAERLKEIDNILNPNVKVTYTFRDLKFKIEYFDGKTEEIKVKGEVSDHVNYLTQLKPKIDDEPETASYTSMPVAYSEIKANEVNNETFEAMAGVPSTKKLFLASGGSEFMVHVEVERVEGEESVWREYEVKYDGCGPSEFRDGDKCPDKTFPSANGASSADTTAKMHTGGTYKAVWRGSIPNKAKAVKVDGVGSVSATCPAEPDRSAYDTAKSQAQAFVAAINAFSPTHTAASDGVPRTWNGWNASISTDTPVDPQTTNNSNT